MLHYPRSVTTLTTPGHPGAAHSLGLLGALQQGLWRSQERQERPEQENSMHIDCWRASVWAQTFRPALLDMKLHCIWLWFWDESLSEWGWQSLWEKSFCLGRKRGKRREHKFKVFLNLVGEREGRGLREEGGQKRHFKTHTDNMHKPWKHYAKWIKQLQKTNTYLTQLTRDTKSSQSHRKRK